eukprot:scaffold56215_cov66-Phaeocystis_antarctica.AAC.2
MAVRPTLAQVARGRSRVAGARKRRHVGEPRDAPPPPHLPPRQPPAARAILRGLPLGRDLRGRSRGAQSRWRRP